MELHGRTGDEVGKYSVYELQVESVRLQRHTIHSVLGSTAVFGDASDLIRRTR